MMGLSPRLWLIGGLIGLLVSSGVGIGAGMTVQHWREAAARESLSSEIRELQARRIAQEAARGDMALEHGRTIERLSRQASETLAAFFEASASGEDALAVFMEELSDAPTHPDAPHCGADLWGRERWLRFDAAGAGDGLRDGDNSDRAADAGQDP
tara:strand:- start:3322 stop:3786 length:465 start_codon:yes stop_codon:yes gene_type:complete